MCIIFTLMINKNMKSRRNKNTAGFFITKKYRY